MYRPSAGDSITETLLPRRDLLQRLRRQLQAVTPFQFFLKPSHQNVAHLPLSRLTIIATSDPTYSPGTPSYGRRDGTSPSAGFKAQVEFQPVAFNCDDFVKKYQISSQLTVWIVIPPVSLQDTARKATQAKGQAIPVNWKQVFPYAYGDQLPFYPLFHEEILNLAGTLAPYSVSQEYGVDVQKVYGIPSLLDLTDSEKLDLSQAVVNLQLQIVKQPGWYVPFTNLLTELEPLSSSARAAYLQTLMSLFKALDPDHTGGIDFFGFEAGGSDGTEIAKLINKLAIETSLPMQEVQQLSFLFPSLLLVGAPSSSSPCLPIDNSALKTSLNNWLNSGLNYEQSSGALHIAEDLSSNSIWGFCLDSFRSDVEIVSLANSLYQKLKMPNYHR